MFNVLLLLLLLMLNIQTNKQTNKQQQQQQKTLSHTLTLNSLRAVAKNSSDKTSSDSWFNDLMKANLNHSSRQICHWKLYFANFQQTLYHNSVGSLC